MFVLQRLNVICYNLSNNKLNWRGHLKYYNYINQFLLVILYHFKKLSDKLLFYFFKVLNETPESIQSNEVTSSSPEDHEDDIRVSQIYNHSMNSNQPQLINHAYKKSDSHTFVSEVFYFYFIFI